MRKINYLLSSCFLFFCLNFFLGLEAKLDDYYLSTSAKNESIAIKIIDSTTENKDEVIKEILSLQGALLANPYADYLPETCETNGFILIKMTQEYVRDLLDKKHARIICANSSMQLLGYLILTDISEFMDLYHDSTIGFFESLMSVGRFEYYFLSQSVGYIEQIAVKAGFSKMGIGKALVESCKDLIRTGLVTDVFIQPHINKASLAFFAKQEFVEIGTLHQEAKADFPAHQTRVLFWLPQRKKGCS